MKKEHKEILTRIETMLSQPGAENLRFWQAMRNCDLIVYKGGPVEGYKPVDDYNLSDENLLKRLKYNV